MAVAQETLNETRARRRRRAENADVAGQEANGAEAQAGQPSWYVIHTYSGYENKVKKNLEQRVSTLDMADKIFEIVVPTEEEIEIRNGQRHTVQRKVFPGYVLVKMIMSDDSWYVVRNTPGVTSFVGMGNKPTALGEAEVQAIIKQMAAEAPRVKVTLGVGQAVRIIDGPFADFQGVIDEINQEKGKVKVLVSFFGRETPVELDFLQVEKLVK
jgi:transcriptional antiterminator NusG